MQVITVGSFEAKTHFSQLLDKVENGAEVHITRNGKPVAVLRREDAVRQRAVRQTLRRIGAHRVAVGSGDIAEFIEAGRDR